MPIRIHETYDEFAQMLLHPQVIGSFTTDIVCHTRLPHVIWAVQRITTLHLELLPHFKRLPCQIVGFYYAEIYPTVWWFFAYSEQEMPLSYDCPVDYLKQTFEFSRPWRENVLAFHSTGKFPAHTQKVIPSYQTEEIQRFLIDSEPEITAVCDEQAFLTKCIDTGLSLTDSFKTVGNKLFRQWLNVGLEDLSSDSFSLQ